MKSSCVVHPPNEPLLIIHKWQCDVCDGNTCAAALLSYFEYWHNIRLEMSQKNAIANDTSEKHGDSRTQDESLVQFHTAEQLSKGMLGLYGKNSIRIGIELLESKGFIRVMRNPNPRYKFDATKHFVFEPEAVNKWIFEHNPGSAQFGTSASFLGQRADETGQRASEIGKSLDNKITSETTTEKQNPVATLPEDVSALKQKANEQKNLLIVQAEAIYECYPRKSAHPVAIKAIQKQLLKYPYEMLLQKTRSYALSRIGQDPQYTPMPATWFNQERFNDIPVAPAYAQQPNPVQRPVSPSKRHSVFDTL